MVDPILSLQSLVLWHDLYLKLSFGGWAQKSKKKMNIKQNSCVSMEASVIQKVLPQPTHPLT